MGQCHALCKGRFAFCQRQISLNKSTFSCRENCLRFFLAPAPAIDIVESPKKLQKDVKKTDNTRQTSRERDTNNEADEAARAG